MQVCLSADCDKHKIPLTKIVGLVVWSEWTLFCFRPNETIDDHVCFTEINQAKLNNNTII